jgi:hypothetical protein
MYLGSTLVSEGTVNPPETYTRPNDWLTLPDVTGLEKFAGLCAVDGGGTDYIALQCAGAYTVDWGDGTAPQDVATNTTAEHIFDYDALAGTECSRGYRQSIVTIVPQVGQNLTKVDLKFKHSASASAERATGWLDVAVAGTQLTTLQIGGITTVGNRRLEKFSLIGSHAITTFASLFRGCHALQSVTFTASTAAVTSFGRMFQDCYKLANLPFFDVSGMSAGTTTAYYMFTNCFALRSIPAFNWNGNGAATDYMFSSCYSLRDVRMQGFHSTKPYQMFLNCYSLETLPLFDTSTATDFRSMFQGCSSLKTIPTFDTSAGTNFTDMFSGCYSLVELPSLDLQKATNLTTMCNYCYSLESVGDLNPGATTATANTDCSNMFANCTSLRTFGTLSTAKVKTMTSMFSACFSLSEAPAMDTSACTTMNTMFQNCYDLQVVPLYDCTALISVNSLFVNCNALATLPAMNWTNVGITVNGAFTGCVSLASFGITGIKNTFTVASCNLGATALNTLYTNLPTVTGKTVTVTGNPGVAGDDPTIAQAKGWTVTG